jgi:hypothetical protein
VLLFPPGRWGGGSGRGAIGSGAAVAGQRKSFFSSVAAVQGFAPVQGLPLVSFHPSSSVYATYTSMAAGAAQPPFLAPTICAAIEGFAATDSVARV